MRARRGSEHGIWPWAPSFVLALIFLVGGAIFLLRGMRRYAPPAEAEAVHLLDRQSPLRPVSSLSDRPADPSRGAQALWVRHRDRVLKAARDLKLPNLSAEWRQLDPFRLRYVLPVALVGIAVLAGEQGPGRLLRALSPDYGALVGAQRAAVPLAQVAEEGQGAPAFVKFLPKRRSVGVEWIADDVRVLRTARLWLTDHAVLTWRPAT